MTIRIVNKNHDIIPNFTGVRIYCGRGSPLGNPFILEKESDRDKVCDKYAIWFQQMIDIEDCDVMNELNRITDFAVRGDVNLECFCAPRRCHCETIKEYVDSVISNISPEYNSNPKYNIIIAGGRDFTDLDLLTDVMNDITSDDSFNYQIISGMARGADNTGILWAKSKGLPIKEFPAEWDKYGKSAGYRRNKEMAQHANCVVAFWDGKSKGTKHMIDIATRQGIPVHIEQY